jgi:hypothetical protein
MQQSYDTEPTSPPKEGVMKIKKTKKSDGFGRYL